ncbi:MAG: hypothetical protein H0U74_15690 [Bradymonadaceae bacterium]|nr:hypothetical protein [Lujinxingiaceae bacterium]
MKPAVLMTDPRHFQIKGGANPHTRLPDNSLKVVDLEHAWPQWHNYVDALLEAGVDVYVIDALPELTGMVFAANAGFLKGRLDAVPSAQKVFYPSHFMVAHRAGEALVFSAFMASFGFALRDYDPSRRFEGEADAFPVGRNEALRWIFTHGFRSDAQIGDWLQDEVLGQTPLALRLTNPSYYHGDTLLCDLGGPFMAWLGGLDADSRERLSAALGQRLVALDDEDADGFVANSFYVETERARLLFAPATIRPSTIRRIEALGIEVVAVDISEFFGKGGGGPKCMVFNLGMIDVAESDLTEAQREFRRSRHISTLRREGRFPGL